MFSGKRIRSVARALSARSVLRLTPRRTGLLATGIVALGFGGCAQSPQQLVASHHPKEYFPASVYGPASRRVIADGQPIPRGGGQYLVGKPYTIAGQTYYPSERRITQVGYASWYGDAFHGRLTANGEIYDRDGFTAAHPTMPLPSYARVTNLRNHYSMIVRVNDRGPYHSNRIMDVSRRVAEALQFERGGTSQIKVEYVGRASLAGSDDAKLYATLRMDGPASPAGIEGNTQVAELAPVRVASAAPEIPHFAYRPERIVENERPEALAAYRAPHMHRMLPGPVRAGPVRDEVALRAHREDDVSQQAADRTASIPHGMAHRVADAKLSRAGRDGVALYPRTPKRFAEFPRATSTSAQARAFAMSEMTPLPARRVTVASRPWRIGPGTPAVPPARPVRFAAASSTFHHAPGGSRLTRSRVD